MMKRCTAFLMTLLLLSGCAQTQVESSSSQTQPEFSTTTVYGKIRTVTGNEILLDLAESGSGSVGGNGPQSEASASSGSSGGRPSNGNHYSRSGGSPSGIEGFSGSLPEGMTGETGGQRPQGMQGTEGTQRQSAETGSTSSFGSARQSSKLTYTGEQKTYLILVGTPVITSSNITVDFNSLSVGTVVTLTLRETEGDPIIIEVNMIG